MTGLSYETLSDGTRGARMPASDALLTDWEGQHWAALDADQGKVAMSWTTDQEFITFQVGQSIHIFHSGRDC